MKIIDLLNKIANGEQPPKKILVNDNIYVWEEDGEYVNVDDELDLLFDFESYCQLQECLNMEVEILETTITYKQDKKIEKLELDEYGNFKRKDGRIHIISPTAKAIIEKIDELIEVINER